MDKFFFQQMNQQEAEEIAKWKYSDIYSFYDIAADEDDYLEFMDSTKRGNKYFSCYADNALVGFYSVEVLRGHEAELGLGLKPNYTGKGYGLGFVNAVITHFTSLYRINNLVFSVASFNQRAIKVYKAAGFVENSVFTRNTNGGEYEFVRMVKKCQPI